MVRTLPTVARLHAVDRELTFAPTERRAAASAWSGLPSLAAQCKSNWSRTSPYLVLRLSRSRLQPESPMQ